MIKQFVVAMALALALLAGFALAAPPTRLEHWPRTNWLPAAGFAYPAPHYAAPAATRPTVSPYLNLLRRETDPRLIPDYQLLVRPLRELPSRTPVCPCPTPEPQRRYFNDHGRYFGR